MDAQPDTTGRKLSGAAAVCLLEQRHINAVIFDKTGTLTLGEFRVVNIDTGKALSEEEALRIAAAIEPESEHPIAQGIVKSAEERELDYPGAEGFQNITGKGVVATVEGREYQMGGPAMVEDADVPDNLRAAAEEAGDNAQTAIYLIGDDKALAVFAVADAIR